MKSVWFKKKKKVCGSLSLRSQHRILERADIKIL